MDRVPEEVPMIGGFTPCGCLVFVCALPDDKFSVQNQWEHMKGDLYTEAGQGLALRIIPRSQVAQFVKCPHDWYSKPKPKYTKYDTSLIAARDGVIAAVEVMLRLRGR